MLCDPIDDGLSQVLSVVGDERGHVAITGSCWYMNFPGQPTECSTVLGSRRLFLSASLADALLIIEKLVFEMTMTFHALLQINTSLA